MTTNESPHPFPVGTESPRLLITAGPTHEPIDAVRYLGNRSSGRLGIDLAETAAIQGWKTTLLLGPTHLSPVSNMISLHRFRTTADLASLLNRTLPECEILIMAAAVADYTPAETNLAGKLRRSESEGMTLKLKPTPDLLASCGKQARPEQLLVGFALEPAKGLEDSAHKKLVRKGIDLIVANPLETMESPDIAATLIASESLKSFEQKAPSQSKAKFAAWLLPILHAAWQAKRTQSSNTQ